jgi:hypothetical protein
MLVCLSVDNQAEGTHCMSQESILQAVPLEGEGSPMSSHAIRVAIGRTGNITAQIRVLITTGELKMLLNASRQPRYIRPNPAYQAEKPKPTRDARGRLLPGHPSMRTMYEPDISRMGNRRWIAMDRKGDKINITIPLVARNLPDGPFRAKDVHVNWGVLDRLASRGYITITKGKNCHFPNTYQVTEKYRKAEK